MPIDINISGQKFILVFFRVASILWLLPLFSSRAVSVSFKAGLSLVISFLLFDLVSVNQTLSSDTYYMLLLILKEVFIGLTISIFVRILFSTVYAAGEVSAFQTGFGFARFMDPVSMTQVSVLEQFINILTIIVFFAIDAHHILIKGIFLSFKELPIGAAVLNNSLFYHIGNLTSSIFSIGLRIGAPLIVTLFIVDLAFGLLSRMIPQINIFIEGMPMKILITFVVLSLSLGIMTTSIVNIFRGMDMGVLKIMRLMV
ncbi:MAG: flagellar biosynthetic protein FliR [Proteobacteria bacterium]|nr:flagellar biosynthetic protein FliR [Pseudomonadota bacterium]